MFQLLDLIFLLAILGYALQDGEKNPPHMGVEYHHRMGDPLYFFFWAQVKVDRMSDAPKDETGMNNETARIEVG